MLGYKISNEVYVLDGRFYKQRIQAFVTRIQQQSTSFSK